MNTARMGPLLRQAALERRKNRLEKNSRLAEPFEPELEEEDHQLTRRLDVPTGSTPAPYPMLNAWSSFSAVSSSISVVFMPL